MLSSYLRLGLPSGLLPSGLPVKMLYAPLTSPMRGTSPAHLILLALITLIMPGEEYKPCSTHVHFPWLRSFQSIRTSPRPFVTFRNIVFFYGGELLAPRPTPKLEGHPLPAVRNCLFNVFAATLHIWSPPPSAT
jgi:hypothetical protein